MDVFDRMATLLKLMSEYDMAIVASKKLLQMAWIIGNQLFELRAYEHLAFNYFYIQNVEKAQFYSNRVVRGIIESDGSGPKATSMSIKHSHKLTNGYEQ